MIRKGANVVIAIGLIWLYTFLASGGALPAVHTEDNVPMEGDWQYYQIMGDRVCEKYGDYGLTGNKFYDMGLKDGATNGVGAVMDEMVITGNEQNGYTVTVLGEEFYYSPNGEE